MLPHVRIILPFSGQSGRTPVTGIDGVITAQLRKALQKGHASQVFLAKNADPALTEPLAALSKEYDIPVAWVSSMQDLGKHCGIEVGAAAAAALK